MANKLSLVPSTPNVSQSFSIERAALMILLKLLVRPVARFCVRWSVSIHDLEEACKVALVEAAAQEIVKNGSKATVSRLSVLTGLYRKEVDRIFVQQDTDPTEPQSILARVIGRWEQDPAYQTKSGSPRVLTFGESSEFYELVQSISTHVGPAAVLFELERNGMVQRTPRGLKLIKGGEVVGPNLVQGFELVSKDIDTIIAAAQENLLRKDAIGSVHIRTEYDNLYEDKVPEIRRWLLKETKALHKRARNFLSRHDADITPTSDKSRLSGAKVVLGGFSFIEPKAGADDKKSKFSLKE